MNEQINQLVVSALLDRLLGVAAGILDTGTALCLSDLDASKKLEITGSNAETLESLAIVVENFIRLYATTDAVSRDLESLKGASIELGDGIAGLAAAVSDNSRGRPLAQIANGYRRLVETGNHLGEALCLDIPFSKSLLGVRRSYYDAILASLSTQHSAPST